MIDYDWKIGQKVWFYAHSTNKDFLEGEIVGFNKPYTIHYGEYPKEIKIFIRDSNNHIYEEDEEDIALTKQEMIEKWLLEKRYWLKRYEKQLSDQKKEIEKVECLIN